MFEKEKDLIIGRMKFISKNMIMNFFKYIL